jgi:hypothetical protein
MNGDMQQVGIVNTLLKLGGENERTSSRSDGQVGQRPIYVDVRGVRRLVQDGMNRIVNALGSSMIRSDGESLW